LTAIAALSTWAKLAKIPPDRAARRCSFELVAEVFGLIPATSIHRFRRR